MSETTTDKNFIKGSAKGVTFDNGGEIINLSLSLDDLNALPAERGYVQLSVVKRNDEDRYGNTHYVVENTFKPDKSKAKVSAPKSKPAPATDEDDLPF